MILRGDGPFTLSKSCFVDDPPPAGFRPCPACSVAMVEEGSRQLISADPTFWRGKRGKLVINIKDKMGNVRNMVVQVYPNPMATGAF